MRQIGATKIVSCEGKEAIANMRLAVKIANRMSQRGKAVHAYRCQFCHKYHVGSVKTV